MSKKNNISKKATEAAIIEQIHGAGTPEQVNQAYVSPAAGRAKPVKAGLYVTYQMLGKKRSTKPPLFDFLRDENNYPSDPAEQNLQKEIIDHKLTIAGIDLSLTEQRALHFIQKKLSENNYKGNSPARLVTPEEQETYKIQEAKATIPRIVFSPTEYLDACGVPKKDLGRGYEEYYGNERDEALKALESLGNKPKYISYKRTIKDKKTGKETRQAIDTVRPVIQIYNAYGDLTQKQYDKFEAGAGNAKITQYMVEPCWILIDRINDRFILTPADMYQKHTILFKGKKPSKYFNEFFLYVLVQATLNRGKNDFSVLLETLADKIHRRILIETRQRKRLRKEIEEYLNKAKIMGYISAFRITNDGIRGDEISYTITPEVPRGRCKELPETEKDE